MNNGRGAHQDRKEPSLSSLADLDAMPSEQNERVNTRSTATPRKSAKPTVAAKPAKTAGLWFFMTIALGGLIAVAGYGYMELQRLKGMQRNMVEQVSQLALASDEIGSQLSASGGKLKETQTTLNSRVEKIETNMASQLKSINDASQANKKVMGDLESQLKSSIAAQEKKVAQLENSLTKTIESKVSSSVSGVQKQSDQQAKDIAAIEANIKTLQANIEKVNNRIASETQNLQQSMALMEEELMNTPNPTVKKLQDQFATYIQSVDQFRQQTNSSLNELSGEVRQLRNSQSQPSSSNSSYSDPYGDSGFGVQPAR